jgi:hypothetical protein
MPIRPNPASALGVCAFNRACDEAGVLVIMSNAPADLPATAGMVRRDVGISGGDA